VSEHQKPVQNAHSRSAVTARETGLRSIVARKKSQVRGARSRLELRRRKVRP